MDRLRFLKERKRQLMLTRRLLDKDAPLNTWEGMQYARVLVELVLIQLEIDQIEKEKAAR
ncbi:hypothetical protein AAFJ72_21275 [Brevibacillus gelatini]|jgi:hypothetical protein|uniref:hypothetical protein n=1 Tax=Brevibacillus gelatini TaxID=1655277 RepID=UPI003D8177C2